LHLLHHLHLLVLLELGGQLLLGSIRGKKERPWLASLKNGGMEICQGWSIQAVVQSSLLQVRRNHAIATAADTKRHLTGHHRLLSHELIVLLLSDAHQVLKSRLS
jgi:hypothetical protein